MSTTNITALRMAAVSGESGALDLAARLATLRISSLNTHPYNQQRAVFHGFRLQ